MIFGELNSALFDWPWSVIHFTSGLIIGMLLTSSLHLTKQKKFWVTGLALLVLWELAEMTLRYLDANWHQTIAPFKQSVAGFAFAPESTANTIGDLIIGSVGLALGRRVRF